MRSATTIQVEGEGGAIMERNTQDTVEQSIFSKVHEKRYTLAGEAPICNGTLFQEFGYTANKHASKAVLDDTYVAATNIDSATTELFAEIALIRRLVPKTQCLLQSHLNNGINTGQQLMRRRRCWNRGYISGIT